MPAFFTAAIESPPPMIVVPFTAATACATALVPAANASISNTPIGPFQTTVFASAIARGVGRDRRRADVEAHPIADRRVADREHLVRRAGVELRRRRRDRPAAASATPRAFASASIAFAASSLSSSTSDLPTGTPRDLKNV